MCAYRLQDNYGNLNAPNKHLGIFPVGITCGSQLSFVYIDIVEYQHLGDSWPVLKFIKSERRLRNGSINIVPPVDHKTYTNLDYKRSFSNNIQSIKIELRSATGKLISFAGIGKVVVNLKFQRKANW